jgi:signal transduction histidine kinase
VIVGIQLVWFWLLGSGQSAEAQRTLILNEQQEQYVLGQFLEYLEDPAGNLTIADVSSPEYSKRFKQSRQEILNFGYTDSIYWVRFQVDNSAPRITDWRLELEFANMHDITFYRFRGPETDFDVIRTGLTRPFATRDIPYHKFVFSLSLPPDAKQTVYLRFRNGASMTLPLTLWSASAFMRHSQQALLLAGFFYGALLVMIGYNIFLWVDLRERSTLFYISFILSILLMQWSYDGFAAQYFWPDALAWKEVAVFVCTACIGITGHMFTMITLSTRERAPYYHAIIVVIMLFWVIILLLIPFISYGTLIRVAVPVRIFASLALVVGSFLIWRRGYQPARYIFWAWLIIIVTNLLFSLLRMGLVPSSPLVEHGYQFGVIVMALLLSRSLADRIHRLHEEKEAVQMQAMKSLQTQEQVLIQKSKLESLGVMAAGIAHEINQPLTRIAFGADSLLLKLIDDRVIDPGILETKCQVILASVDRISRIIDHIRTFSRDQALVHAERIDVHATIDNALSLIQTQYQHHNIVITTDLQATGWVIGNQYKLEQVLLNLLSNSKDAIQAKTRDITSAFQEDVITIRTFNTPDQIIIEIADTGTGIAADELPHIFDPFFTTKEEGKGTGLGLSISYGIIKDMHGGMRATSRINVGTAMQIMLPCIHEQ